MTLLILVLAENLALMFVGWEGVGLCSYLLIGFWYEKPSAADAGLKAFISAQEVLCENFGRKRKAVAIGIYDASSLAFPVRYEAAPAEGSERAFTPLPPAGEPDEVRDGARVA